MSASDDEFKLNRPRLPLNMALPLSISSTSLCFENSGGAGPRTNADKGTDFLKRLRAKNRHISFWRILSPTFLRIAKKLFPSEKSRAHPHSTGWPYLQFQIYSLVSGSLTISFADKIKADSLALVS